MLSKRVALVVVALCCLFALTPSALFSQSSTTGAVTGVVTDPTGSVVPGATITLTQQDTNATQSTSTDSSCRYLFPAASPGTYTLKSTGKGFRTSTITHIVVEVLKSTTIDIKFEMGSQSEVVEVVAATGAELQTQDASIGTVISGDMLLRLPSQQRSITAILMQQPAVSPAGNQGDDVNGGQVAGALVDQTTFFVDGGDATSDLEGTNSYVSPPGEPQPAPFIAVPSETVQEFRVVTASPTSDFARSLGFDANGKCLGGKPVQYSLAPGGVSNLCDTTGTAACDPRGLGMDALIKNYFALLPEPNNFGSGDGLNSAGFTSSFAQPVIEHLAVGKVDYVISPKWSVFGTYHYNRYRLATTNQFDITAGKTPHLVSNTPVEP